MAKSPDSGSPSPVAPTSKAEYFGVGCFSAFAGFAAGGMIAVLIAKIVGGLSRCAPDAETGAPCNWFTYMVFGMIIGTLVMPVVSLWFFRRGRARANAANNDRG